MHVGNSFRHDQQLIRFSLEEFLLQRRRFGGVSKARKKLRRFARAKVFEQFRARQPREFRRQPRRLTIQLRQLSPLATSKQTRR